jgi:hypothetical protein
MHNFAAGVVAPRGSCAGFISEKMRGLDKYKAWALPDTLFENDQEWIYGVSAYKAFFLIGDQFVALGAGISNMRPDLGGEIRTTIDQTLLVDPELNGERLEHSDFSRLLLKPVAGHSKSVSIENNGFVYQILPEQTPGEVWVSLERRMTRWDELNIQNPQVADKSTSADVFQIWISHGGNPRDGRYGYVVYCGSDQPPPVPKVLSNDSHIQAIAETGCEFIQSIFYLPDTLRCDEVLLHVSAPCAFSAEISSTSVLFAVSDARIDSQLDSIVITTNLPLTNANRLDNNYQVRIPLPTGIYRGKQATASFKLQNSR